MVRTLYASLIATITSILLLIAAPNVAARDQYDSGDGYDWWTDCSDVPDPLEFLPIYTGTESAGFVDLHRNIDRRGVQWRQMQYTRDKDLGLVRISAGRWYGGMGADEWPVGSGMADAKRHLERFRVVSWEIDGTRQPVDPSCVMVLNGEDHVIGFYNAWVRFSEPGMHTLKITGRQTLEFYFIHPSVVMGLSDPLGLDGRRVFMAGEFAGDAIDDEFTHTYALMVGKW